MASTDATAPPSTLATTHHLVLDNLLGATAALDLRSEVLALRAAAPDAFVPGRTGGDRHTTALRGDVVARLDDFTRVPALAVLLARADALVEELSHSVPELRGVTSRSQPMLACYPPKSRYVTHVDNPDGNGRLLTFIYYLNAPDWSAADGGELRLHGDAPTTIEPLLDRAVCFFSDARVPHEVLPSATRERWAASVWFHGTADAPADAAAPAEMLSFEGREHEFLLALAALEPTASAAPCELPLRPLEPPLYLSAAAPPLAAAAVASFVQSALDPRGRRILALGRGGGVVGLALARLGARHVCIAAADAAEIARIAEDARQSLPPAVQVACGSVSVVALDRPHALAGRDFDWMVALDADAPSLARRLGAELERLENGALPQGLALYSWRAVAAAAAAGRTLAAGGDYFSLAVEAGALYSWGGQHDHPGDNGDVGLYMLGHGDAFGQPLTRPRRVATALWCVDVREVAAGATHALLLSRAGVAFSFGENSRGQLGAAGHSRLEPLPIDALADVRCARAACGQQFSLVVSTAGEVWSFGCCATAQLGRPCAAAWDATPGRVDGLAAARCVAGGDGHALCVCADGTLLSWGGGASGALGHGDDAAAPRPRAVAALAAVDVRDCACGEAWSLAADADGRVWSWGCGADGRLGHGDERDRWVPTPVAALAAVAVRAVSAGGEHAVLLAADGAVYTCGGGGDGQLGHGDRAASLAPRRVDGVADAAEVVAGAACTLVRRRGGGLATWGCGAGGKLGHGDEAAQLAPRALELAAAEEEFFCAVEGVGAWANE